MHVHAFDYFPTSPQSDWPAQPRKVVMLVPTVLLVAQQAAAIVANTDLAVGEFSSDATIAQRIHLDYFEW